MSRYIKMLTTASDASGAHLEGRVYEVGKTVSENDAAAYLKGGPDGKYAVEVDAPKAAAASAAEQAAVSEQRAREDASLPGGDENTSAPVDTRSPLEVLSTASIAAITAALPKLTDEEVQKLHDLESAKESPRAGAIKALDAEIERRTAPPA